jgi:hypothetical protein
MTEHSLHERAGELYAIVIDVNDSKFISKFTFAKAGG